VDWFKVKRANAKTLSKGGAGAAQTPPVALAATRPIDKRFPRFLRTATDQIEPGSSDDATEVRRKVSDSFKPSRPVTDYRMFAGRVGVLTTLIQSIEDHRMHIVLYGERGIGKTSMMHILAQAAQEARYLCVYISCGADTDFDDVFRVLARGIPLLFHQNFGPASERSERGETFADLIGEGPISVHAAGDLLARVVGTRIILMLDEFDRCESKEFKQSVAELMKNLSDRSACAQLAIAGVAANLTELVEHIPSIQRNILALQVPRMTDEEVLSLIARGEAACNMTFADEPRRLIVSTAAGMPHLASLLCHHAALLAVDDGRLTVGADDVAKAMERALAELKGRISKRSQLESAILMGRPMKLLVQLADALGPSTESFTTDDIYNAFRSDKDALRCIELVENLGDEGVLLASVEDDWGAHYRFVEHGALAYLRLLYSRAEAPAVLRQSRR
jgi:Cdc6-like AAA superfamily ATPase